MATYEHRSIPIELPPLPAQHTDWIQHVAAHPEAPLRELIEPYKEYDSKLREVFAQQPEHPAVTIPNVVPIFDGHEQELKVRARNLEAESKTERQRYLMPLDNADRKPDGSPAIVQSLKEFQTNFQLFSESSLVDLDWSNVVVAGSAVVTSLLPVPEEHNHSKRALREYYHQQLAPASDVDLFLYDLTEEQAVDKIKQIEQRIKDSILTETTTVRTKNAITIASQYPTRHVQIVLRIYRSISEILTGFDVDCSCAAYNGQQVYASPRALAAYMTQINTIDLTRRSPSYENRLSKYARRGFEVYWPLLDRSRIDPTLFERSFGRTLGLARLLVLEKLPTNEDREAYVDQRRAERGRPAINRWTRRRLKGNMKEDHDEEVAEWVETDQVSDYHTFTIPYGPQYYAGKIERLLYAKDLLLNAEWNRPKERETALHRHPAFFGNAIDVIGDCCGYCPQPITPEDQEIAEEEGKIYVTGALSFVKDDPGRQAIGSFNPLTDNDWTEMAYLGNTARLCQAIVERDLEHVQDWLNQEGADPNQRDYTGRTPLQLAVTTSTPQIVQALIDAGARIVARLFDGKTALHLAAMRGEVEMVKALLIKSEANEEKESEKKAEKKTREKRHQEQSEMHKDLGSGEPMEVENVQGSGGEEDDSEEEDIDMLDDESQNMDATTEGSVIKIDRKSSQPQENHPDDTNEDEPDVYDVNVLAWDAPVSALHLAIANGHTDVVKTLVQDFGADVLLPIKLVHDFDKSPRAAILPAVLALQLPPEKAKEMTKVLVSLGASPAQGDVDHVTALHYFTAHGADLLRTMISANRPVAQQAVSHLRLSGSRYSPNIESVLLTAIEHGNDTSVDLLLDLGAKPEVDFATYMRSYKTKWGASGSSEKNEENFRNDFEQPVFSAVRSDMPSIVRKLLDAGADVNSLTPRAWTAIRDGQGCEDQNMGTLLDIVRTRKELMRTFVQTGKVHGQNGYLYSTGWVDTQDFCKEYAPIPLQEDAEYLQDHEPNTYAHWMTAKHIVSAKSSYEEDLKRYQEWLERSEKESEGTEKKKAAVQMLLTEFEVLESQLLERGAKTFQELHPYIDVEVPQPFKYRSSYKPERPKPWKPLLTFQIPDLTDERRAAYVKLFQACWDGDLPTIKELTLALWEDNQSPLQVAVQDSHNFSPFSIAVLRKHLGIAKAIMEIAHAQYAPEEKPEVKHTLQPTDGDDYNSSDGDEFRIYAEIVDDRFTIENIGEVQTQVKSNVMPLEMISWSFPVFSFLEDDDQSTPLWLPPSGLFGKNCTYDVQSHPTQKLIPEDLKPGNLFQFAIYLDDANLLEFLLARSEECIQQNKEATEEVESKFPPFDEADFLYAIRLGRVRLLEIIVKNTGSGIPLNALVKKSGIEISVKPRYYQGLTVHGKKRADWANEGREIQAEDAGAKHPPLLHAARLGSLESVEWFLSNIACMRCYSEFTDRHRDDVRIQHLTKAQGGMETSIAKWLDLRSHLLLHCVVLGKTTKDSLRLLRHLCKLYPKALGHRDAAGMTPLHLAFALRRTEMAKILLEAGADQTTRSNVRANIVHSILSDDFPLRRKEFDRVRELLGLINGRLISSLFTERTTKSPGAATPLACWLNTHLKDYRSRYNYYDNDDGVGNYEKLIKLILEYTKGEDLNIVNGEGDTPIHAVVRYGADTILRIMLECRPELLFRENASGRTPYEMAEDAYLAKEVFNGPPSLSASYDRRSAGSVLERDPERFIEEPKDLRSGVEKVWLVCKEFAEKSQGRKRKLVSLVEANEVAKRLARMYGSGVADADEDEEKSADEDEKEDEDEDIGGDEVAVWFYEGLNADVKEGEDY
jgi:ankyrin repeat protein